MGEVGECGFQGASLAQPAKTPGLPPLLAIFTALLACSPENLPVNSGSHGPSGFNQQSVLSLVGFTGSIVNIQKRFASYTKAAERVSLIDPDSEKEAWGAQISGAYDAAVPLPKYAGVALLSGSALTLLTPSGQRFFAAPNFSVGHAAFARDIAAYALVSSDGQNLHVIRDLQNGKFQESDFVSPWEDLGGYSTPPDGSPPLAVAVYSSDGSRLVWFRPSDGRYAVYKADAQGAPLAEDISARCPGDGIGTPKAASYRSLAYDDDKQVVYLGDYGGHVSVIDPSQCKPVKDLPTVTLGDGRPVTDLSVQAAGQVIVTQAGGQLHLLAFNGKQFATPDTYTGLCAYPLGALPVEAGSMALICFHATNFDATAESRDAPAVIAYTDAFIQMIDLSKRAASGLTIPLNVRDAAGMAIDSAGTRLLTLESSAFGVLDTVNLKDGSKTQKKGLFLTNILH